MLTIFIYSFFLLKICILSVYCLFCGINVKKWAEGGEKAPAALPNWLLEGIRIPHSGWNIWLDEDDVIICIHLLPPIKATFILRIPKQPPQGMGSLKNPQKDRWVFRTSKESLSGFNESWRIVCDSLKVKSWGILDGIIEESWKKSILNRLESFRIHGEISWFASDLEELHWNPRQSWKNPETVQLIPWEPTRTTKDLKRILRNP